MILVAGILALLVIIATAYLTRTQGGRITGVAVQRAQQRDDSAEQVAHLIIDEIIAALFPWPVDPFDPFVSGVTPFAADPNFPRLLPPVTALRYGVDRDFIDRSSGTPVFNAQDGVPDFPYNIAPYATVPYTNWPDFAPSGNPGIDTFLRTIMPTGPGHPDPNPSAFSFNDLIYNPPGNPGFGDSRWLANLEPLRWTTGNASDSMQDSQYQPDAFSHWLHLTNLSRPNNGWRIITDIADIGDQVVDPGGGGGNGTGLGSLITNLTIPVEQWLPLRHNQHNSTSGDSTFQSFTFFSKWKNWFELNPSPAPLFNYLQAFNNPSAIPPNYYRLKDANANGFPLEIGERPLDEFIEIIPERWRHAIGRILADTDGDGFTDAFWHLAPIPVINGQMTIVAVRIIDNSAMLNVNVATAFDPTSTVGATPADLALVGVAGPIDFNNPFPGHLNVGFYDNPEHWYSGGQLFGYDTTRWSIKRRHILEIGISDVNNDGFPNTAERLDYWFRSGNRPLYPDPTSLYVPFSLDNELSLRANHGNNDPWNYTTFEWSVQDISPTDQFNFLRANKETEESVELNTARKDNRMLVRDPRHRLTMYNATRNDLLPPWLWPNLTEFPWIDFNNNGIFDTGEDWFADINNNGIFELDEAVQQWQDSDFLKMDLRFQPASNTNPQLWADNRRIYRENLRHRFEQLLLIRDPLNPGANPPTYSAGYFQNNQTTPPDPTQQKKALEMAAALAANVDSYRDSWDFDYQNPPVPTDIDEDPVDVNSSGTQVSNFTPPGFNPAPIRHAVPVREWDSGQNKLVDTTTAILGLEPQPFLTEAFLCHVHSSEPIPTGQEFFPQDTNWNYVDNNMPQTTISVVQISNPSGKPIDLAGYKIKWFGQPLNLADLNPAGPNAKFMLKPSTSQFPVTYTFCSISNQFSVRNQTVLDFRSKWLDFLDLQDADLDLNNDGTPDSKVFMVDSAWEQNRSWYDNYPPDSTPPHEKVVELLRCDDFDPSIPGCATEVVIDRFDYAPDSTDGNIFRDHVTDRMTIPPNPLPPTAPCLPGIHIPQEDDVWVTWARVTRAWGRDSSADVTNLPVDLTGTMTPRDESPRFIFADQLLVTPPKLFHAVGNPCPPIGQPPQQPNNDIEGAAFNLTGQGGSTSDPPDGTVLTIQYNDQVPDPWFVAEYKDESGTKRVWKPTFFSSPPYHAATAVGNMDGIELFYPNKGFYGTRLDYPLQLLQKDGDFQQLGELLNIWTIGHKIEISLGVPGHPSYERTLETFSEQLRILNRSMPLPNTTLTIPDEIAADLEAKRDVKIRVGRLQVKPVFMNGSAAPGQPMLHSPIVGHVGVAATFPDPNYYANPQHAAPNLPMGVRLLDAFVCDGPGVNPQHDIANPLGNIPLNLASGFTGKPTHGLINISTAPIEVMQAMPEMTKVVHRNTGIPANNPKSMIPESIVQYRNHQNGSTATDGILGHRGGPNYSIFHDPDPFNLDMLNPDPNNPGMLKNIRRDTGFASIGELTLLDEPGRFNNGIPFGDYGSGMGPLSTNQTLFTHSWRMDFARFDPQNWVTPFPLDDPAASLGARLSTDVIGPDYDSSFPTGPNNDSILGDMVSGDAEEANLLFAGISNLVTTRSDTFTVYFKIRTFKQNPITGVWNATDPEMIVDQARYVMLVDRSTVNHPNDKPKILYLEKLPQ